MWEDLCGACGRVRSLLSCGAVREEMMNEGYVLSVAFSPTLEALQKFLAVGSALTGEYEEQLGAINYT